MIGETPPDGDGGVSPAIVHHVSITTAHSQVSYVSNLTGNAPVSPVPQFPVSLVSKLSHLGIPLIPPSRMMNMPDEKLFGEGYDSDIQSKPFYETGVSDEMFVGKKKELIDYSMRVK